MRGFEEVIRDSETVEEQAAIMKTFRMNKRGFTLVELMIVVAIVGVLAALAIYGVTKYVANAKTAEARTAVNRMAKDATSAYYKEKMAGSVLELGGVAVATNELCASASATVPASADSIKGQKYQSSPAEWNPAGDDQKTGWKCLGFSMTDPQYYMYDYQAETVTGTGASFTASAQGDLDGDGVLSTFSMTGTVAADETGETVLTLAPALHEENPQE